MLKLSKLTDYGALLMTALAARPLLRVTAGELAEHTHLAPPTVAKLLKRLAQSGLVESTRGTHGGYRLARAPEAITVADVVRALEGPIGLTECSIHRGCDIESSCAARGNWRLINTAIREALEAITLAQMAAPLRTLPARSTDLPLTFHRSGARAPAR